jgi:hypothetical protein
VENSEANDGCLEEKKDGIELVAAFVAREVTNPVKKRLLLTKYSGPSSTKFGIPLSSELAKSSGVKREKRMKKARSLAK